MATLILLWLAAVLLVALGFVGTVFPALPGTPLIFSGLLLGAWIDNFSRVGAVTLGFLGFLALLAVVIDFIASALGAKKAGASKLALFGAAVGTVVGVLFFPPLGLLIGPFIGAFGGEYLSNPDARQAGKVGLATWLGTMLGLCAKIAIAFSMIGIFAFFYVI